MSDRYKLKRWPEALIVLQSIVYGVGDPVSKIAFEVTPVYTMMTVRYLIAFIVCFVLFRKRIIETVRTVPVKVWLVPGVCIGLTYLLNNVALAITDATSVAFIRSLTVVITPLFAFLIYHTRYRWQHIVLQILVLPGLYLLCVRGGLSGFGIGEIVAIITALFGAAALVFTGKSMGKVDPVSMTALQAGCSALLALPCCLVFEGGLQLEATTPAAWGIIVYLAVGCTVGGYLMQNIALTKISDREVALLQTLCPVMTALFAFLLLGESLSVAGKIGAAVIIVCVALSSMITDDARRPDKDN